MSKVSEALAGKFTPGPWAAYEAYVGKTLIQCIDIGAKPHGTRPCIIDSGGFDSCDLPKNQRIANANLIAAAPDMAALLLRCKPALEFALSLYRFKAAWSEDDNTCALYAKKRDEVESILAEMGEEKK